MRLFVYGTLRRGFHNHSLMSGADFLGTDTVLGSLYTSAPNGDGIPFLLPGTGEVHGEVYEIPDKLLGRLDMLEGHPTWYTRKERELGSGDKAFVYVYDHPEHAGRFYLAPSGTYGVGPKAKEKSTSTAIIGGLPA